MAVLAAPELEEEQSFEDWQEEQEEDDAYMEDDTSGDYTLDYVYDYFKMRLLDDLQATPSEAREEVAEDPDLPVQGDVIPYETVDEDIDLLSVSDTEHFVNVLRYDCTVSGTAYTLLFSPSYQDQIYVDSSGNLWNMGSSQITGRVLTDMFDPYADTGTLVYLAPCLGNNFATNHNYNSPNWFRRYYYSGDRLYYDDTYVRITVDKYFHTYLSGDLLTYVLIFLIGGCLICLWKRSSR